jgi:hypothetical protein
MVNELTAGLVRILDSTGATVGTGFIVTDEGLIATCVPTSWEAILAEKLICSGSLGFRMVRVYRAPYLGRNRALPTDIGHGYHTRFEHQAKSQRASVLKPASMD